MPGGETERSRELDQVRRLLFPDLSPEEGWRKIEEAMAAAEDEHRMKRIEELAEGDLSVDLTAALRRLRERAPSAAEDPPRLPPAA